MPPKLKSKKKPAPDPPPPQVQLPNWPPLTPLLPREDLTLVPLLEGQIYTIPSFFTSTLCATYRSFLSTLPLTTTPGKPKRGEAVRVNDRFQVQDAVFAGRVWEAGVGDLVREMEGVEWGGEVLGLNPNIRVYRYKEGMFFGQHYDESNNIDFSIPGASPVRARTTWTLLIYLSGLETGCEGGETVFHPEPPKGKGRRETPEPIVVEMRTGTALLHRHGEGCLLHEGAEVRAGEKWVLRSDVCVRR
ncbi:hypothetical protein EJ06DRAFT_511861 [Trichodelitschia bisporula]|uniref:Fe2OG dioxygenase domain-containing protein n=1 Tax=Trichodelitschia bisporula TaxID=703511 RepID=A0A6G1HUC4_9PEZI|nr:hypothetical protein EJ06DRAFT_511861 [Trichodelitschia bisporula]